MHDFAKSIHAPYASHAVRLFAFKDIIILDTPRIKSYTSITAIRSAPEQPTPPFPGTLQPAPIPIAGKE